MFELATATPGQHGTITYKLWDAFTKRFVEKTVSGSGSVA